MRNYSKSLQSIGLASLFALGLSISTQTQAVGLPFSVNPSNIVAGSTGEFQAYAIGGSFNTLVSLNGTPNATGTGYIKFDGFADAGGTTIDNTGINISGGYNLWAEYTYSLTLTSGTYGQENSTYNVDNLAFTFWIDKQGQSIFNPAIMNSAANPSVTHSAGAVQLAEDNGFIIGVAVINTLGGTGFNSTVGFTLTDPNGPNFFTKPIPFHNISFNEFNNTSQSVKRFTVGEKEYLLLTGTGSVDFNNAVPEPTALALFAAGLLGFGFIRRRNA